MQLNISEFKRAEMLIEQMQSADNLQDYEYHWKDFLALLERGWNRIDLLLKDIQKAHSIRNEVRTKRKSDPLIQYLKQARDTEEHTISETVEIVVGGVSVTGVDGGVTIISGVIRGDGTTENLVSKGNLLIVFTPTRLVIKDIVNRGITYMPPTLHLGESITTLVPHELATIGFRYYQKKLDEINAILL